MDVPLLNGPLAPRAFSQSLADECVTPTERAAEPTMTPTATEQPVTVLPSTGQGESTAGDSGARIALLLASLVVLLLAGFAAAQRRPG